ncbi:hypothetical protein FHR81_003844 [Actinoalloteichus hoggarensis]|uniref:Putative peptidoglycan biosynthesis protein MviN n=1 Tax=Actinoalloteichus hoggarensis TaxID=1470176 RepID=A0A221WB31_9PSEU|nr:protein kinase family protein [Actinoalloteichus hoggarensis]ASO23182.1 putative peptidoglycan biosynthesis protein MviN [Actinoalloteichus hoggarensis]MBB5922787.1 hypothetical protein [Actinoalloteichus hoggarensis]
MSGKPTEYIAPNRKDTGQGVEDAGLAPGTVLGDGRYRLIGNIGQDVRGGAQLWRAKDSALGRDVALTILVGDRGDTQVNARARRALERAMHAASFHCVGAARVLDVISAKHGLAESDRVLGIVVAEWTHGTDLAELVKDNPVPPATAARLLQSLAVAVETAHHVGLVLGIDHPQRIRVSADGELRFAFPGVRPEASATDDVRGLGAVLFYLLTGRWPLPDAPVGVPTVELRQDATPVTPRSLRPIVPLELSNAAVKALAGPDSTINTGGIRTAAAMIPVLERAAATEDSGTNVMRQSPIGNPAPENDVWRDRDPEPDQARKRKLSVGMAILGVATLLIVGWLGFQVAQMFAPGGSSNATHTILPSGVEGGEGGADEDAEPDDGPPVAAGPVAPAGVTEWQLPGKNPDHPDRAGHAIDGDAATAWATSEYNVPFDAPNALKAGVGLVMSFPEVARLAEVTVNSPSAGGVIEVRTSPSATPGGIEETTLVGTLNLTGGDSSLAFDEVVEGQYVMIWVTGVVPVDSGRHQTRIAEVTFQQAE